MIKIITPDRNTIINILGGLMSQPDILNQVDKYNFEVNDFPLLLDRFIFSAIYNLYCGGAEVIRTIDIDNYLQGNELAKKTFDEENGIAFLQDCYHLVLQFVLKH